MGEATCKRCGACCMLFRLGGLTPAEAHLLGWENTEPADEGTTYAIRRVDRPGLPAWSGGSVCVFYDEAAGCTIHDTHKPALCRDFACNAYHLMKAVAVNLKHLAKQGDGISNAAQYQIMQEFLASRPELREDPLPAFDPMPIACGRRR
jgi:Fe-S-cluster containining protein